MYITWHTIITAGAVLGATLTFVGVAWKVIDWFLVQKLTNNNTKEALVDLQTLHNNDIKAIEIELCILSEAMLATLDGLTQLHCNGNVSKAYAKLENHLNKQAHQQAI